MFVSCSGDYKLVTLLYDYIMGISQAVRQRTLTPSSQVRILNPQPLTRMVKL